MALAFEGGSTMTAATVLRGPGGHFAGSRKRAGVSRSSRRRGHNRQAAPAWPMAYDPTTDRGAGYGLRHGDPRVRALQTALNALGIRDGHGRPLVVDGKLGPLTTHAVQTLQRRLHLKPDGRVTAQLLAQIQRLARAHPAKKTTARAALARG